MHKQPDRHVELSMKQYSESKERGRTKLYKRHYYCMNHALTSISVNDVILVP